MANRLISFYQSNCLLSLRNWVLSGCSFSTAEGAILENKYLLVLDFEATCENAQKIEQEIIEFPCLKVNLRDFKEEARFHHFIKPVINPQLTKFCVELTGILQEVVDEAKEFPDIYYLFEKWREEQGLTEENSVYITSGDWDLGHMMPRQCTQCNLPVPKHMKQWIDIKKLFGNYNEVFYNSFSEIMNFYGLKFIGRAHSGINDCLNMLQAIKKMAESNIDFSPTSFLVKEQNGFKVRGLNERSFSTGGIKKSSKVKDLGGKKSVH